MVKLMDLPKSDCRITGDTEDVYKLMNDFFINTKKYIESRLDRCPDFYFDIKSGEIVYNSQEENLDKAPQQVVSDDRITCLKFKEKYNVAGMLETRTECNNVQFTFFRNLDCLEDIISQ